MNLGDLVVRKSYGGDVLFRIEQLARSFVMLKGIQYRLLADAPLHDIQAVQDMRISHKLAESEARVLDRLTESVRAQRERIWRQSAASPASGRRQQAFFDMPGKILHLDGDANYLRKSMAVYGKLNIPAEGMYVTETNMPTLLQRLLPQVRPDVVVVTGHDGMLKQREPLDPSDLNSYKNSAHFVQSVQIARQYERDRDGLVVVAGACQSHFEALLQAGANFASSPGRILIHALDPVAVAAKAAFTSVKETVNLPDVIHQTVSGVKGMGGIETKGTHRLGYPHLQSTADA
ncbi:sporulation peptidase YabG [Paenibacillus sp. y28]|uniref:sporulation peptidase YabG n=1 Tax=Paenibacillus sp. y28 TaxID=3129110 RepID=UPI0030170CCE